MYWTTQELLPWEGLIPYAVEALDVPDGETAITGLNKSALVIHIRQKTSQFLRDTALLQDEIVLTGQCRVDRYKLYESDDYRINTIKQVIVGGVPLQKCPWAYDGRVVPPQYYNELPNNTIIVGRPPSRDIDEYIRVWCTFIMSPKACGIPITIFEDYGYGIVAGAVADSFKMAIPKGEVVTRATDIIQRLEVDYENAVHNGKSKAEGLLGGGTQRQITGSYDDYLDGLTHNAWSDHL